MDTGAFQFAFKFVDKVIVPFAHRLDDNLKERRALANAANSLDSSA